MKLNTRAAGLFILGLISLSLIGFGAAGVGASPRTEDAKAKPPEVQYVSADELKAKLTKNEAVTIIDVRGGAALESDNKIKGAVYVKLRKLKSRLGMPPLRDVPRDREVVTYCACPNDESSIRAAQLLTESGFKRVRVLKGGWVTWKRANGQVEPFAKGM
jgi:rhodanese-related sulfurtransferase